MRTLLCLAHSTSFPLALTSPSLTCMPYSKDIILTDATSKPSTCHKAHNVLQDTIRQLGSTHMVFIPQLQTTYIFTLKFPSENYRGGPVFKISLFT